MGFVRPPQHPAQTYTVTGLVLLALLSLLTMGLLGTALGTQYWLAGPSWNTRSQGRGEYHVGLFRGQSHLENSTISRTHHLWMVCHKTWYCMYCCADTKNLRYGQMEWVMEDQPNRFDVKKHCTDYDPSSGEDDERPGPSLQKRDALPPMMKGNNPKYVDRPNFADFANYVGVVACVISSLACAVFTFIFVLVSFCIMGPVWIYASASLGSFLSVLAVVLWVVQVNAHLTFNILLYDSHDYWTTRGQEHYGYSFWLVVAAAVLHAFALLTSIVGQQRKPVFLFQGPSPPTYPLTSTLFSTPL